MWQLQWGIAKGGVLWGFTGVALRDAWDNGVVRHSWHQEVSADAL